MCLSLAGRFFDLSFFRVFAVKNRST